MTDREERRQELIARGHVIHYQNPAPDNWRRAMNVSECNEHQAVVTDRPEEVTCDDCIAILAGEVAHTLRGGWWVR